MRILAFNPGAHDASAAVFDDYKLVAAVGEERLTRRKGSGDGVPWLAIDEVLTVAGWRGIDVDAIATTREFFAPRYLHYPPYKQIDYAVRGLFGKAPKLRQSRGVCGLVKLNAKIRNTAELSSTRPHRP